MSGFSNNSNVPLAVELGFTNQSPSVVDVFDRRFISTSQVLVSGTIYFTCFTPLQNLTVTKINYESYSVAAVGTTLARLGLYSYDETTATLLAQTAIDNGLFASNYTNYQRSFDNSVSSFVNLIAGKRYATGLIWVGATPPNILMDVALGAYNNSPKLNGVKTGQADLLASTTIVQSATGLYSRLQP